MSVNGQGINVIRKIDFIAAAMAQNTAFGLQDMREIAEKNWTDRNFIGGYLEINWANYTRFMLQLFTQNIAVLHSVFGWDLPPEITTTTLESMMSLALWGE